MKQSVPKPPPGDRPLKTLERILSKAGLGSRKDARMWIGDGRAQVNGNVVRDPDAWIDVERDSVAFDGEELRNEERVYLLLHKPVGYLTTNRDPHGRPTIYDLLPDGGPHVSYVGRLDLDTSGLLILTNDTQFAERLTNPEYHVPKTYRLTANRPLGDADLDLLRNGVELRDGPTRPAHVTRVSESAFEITITEGRNRQVRRMVEALDAEVVTLVRIAIGSIRIGDLPSGQMRPLTADEVRALGVESREWGVGAKP
ncbi:MAG TPA: pseudouridine synthase [Thermoanaerobaculia bacterium]|nr:pseudouridine synthase [Thermoanaerobaculia bacterium]